MIILTTILTHAILPKNRIRKPKTPLHRRGVIIRLHTKHKCSVTDIALNGITNFFEDKYGIIAAQCWKQGVRVHSEICGLFDDKQTHASVIKQAHEQIKKYEPSYQPPEIDMSKSGACYVATAVYGSYDCPQVWTLRRYRDDTLSKTWYGRAFIRTYYSISPKLVKWFGNKRWFNRFLKPKLDRMVN